MHAIHLLGIALLLALVPLGTAVGQQASPFGPGIAGQLHALAYDPIDPNIIYAGGDNCGVYRSDDHGQSWTLFNQGMMATDIRKASYVDDLLVLSSAQGVPTGGAGVYAATHGGIYFFPENGSQWVLKTGDPQHFYATGYAEGAGAAIPFCALAYDAVDEVVYAAAGSARLDGAYREGTYPESSTGDVSLWALELDGSGVWQPMTTPTLPQNGDVNRILQIDVLVNPAGTGSRVVVAATEGVYLETADGTGWDQIWTPGSMGAVCTSIDAQDTFGIGVGKDGNLYAMTRDYVENPTRGPAVWLLEKASIIAGEYVYNRQIKDWVKLGGELPQSNVLPQNQLTWLGIIHSDGHYADLANMAVVAGDATTDDQVFVGMMPGDIYDPYNPAPKSYNGYFRYGKYNGTETGWLNILYRENPLNWQSDTAVHKWVDYDANPITVNLISNNGEYGWAGCYHSGSTVPFQVASIDPSYRFAAQYHIPMAIGDADSPAAWEQRYCTGGPTEYTFTGLSIMSARAVGFTETSNQLVLGCGDFVGFLGADGSATAFKYLDPYWPAMKTSGGDVLTIGDEIYMLRGGPIQYRKTFGFQDFLWDESTSQIASRQRIVIARYDENYGPNNSDPHGGYNWYFISQSFDGLVSGGEYMVADIEASTANTMFAAVNGENAGYVFRGTRSGPGADWIWTRWWDSTEEDYPSHWTINSICVIPGTTRLLMAVHGQYVPNSLQELSTVDDSIDGTIGDGPEFTPVPWLSYGTYISQENESDYGGSHRMTKSIKHLTLVECDPDGDWLYLASQGQFDSGQYDGQCANIIRTRIPSGAGVPGVHDWDLLLNDEDIGGGGLTSGIEFGMMNPACWPDYLESVPYSEEENLPRIWSLAIHPDDPKRVFVAIRISGYRADETFHQANGVWEYQPYGDSGSWNQVWGGSVQPNKGATAIAFDPENSGRLIIGTFGQGFFRMEGIPSSPADGFAYTDRSSETGMSYDGQPLNGVAVDRDGDGDTDLLMTRVAGADDEGMSWETNYFSSNGVPNMTNNSLSVFQTLERPLGDTAGLIAADYDNDGKIDLFAPHASGCRLYRNLGSSYDDVTSVVGLDGGYASSISGSWGDYDGDGDLDLLIMVKDDSFGGYSDMGAPVQRLFRNDLQPDGTCTFTDVTVDTGLDDLQSWGHSALWADFDGSGSLDLVMMQAFETPGSPGDGIYSRYLILQPDGTFTDVADTRLPGHEDYWNGMCGYAAVADVNLDGHPDIVFVNSYWRGYFLNDGAGSFTEYEVVLHQSPLFPLDLDVIDYDLDGRKDLLVSTYMRPWLFAVREQGSDLVLVDETASAGLDDQGVLYAATPADYNEDGLADMFMARTDAGGFFYKAAQGAQQLARHWVGIRLESPHGANNYLGLGARVTVTAGGVTQAQVVDGGSGRAGQAEASLVFGLGYYTGGLDVEIAWPNGHTQAATLESSSLDGYVTISDDSPVVDDDTVDFGLVYWIKTGKQDWEFTWETFNACDTTTEKVVFHLDDVSFDCLPGRAVLDASVASVEIATPVDLGNGKWEHKLTWKTVPCVAGCLIPFHVESSVIDYTTTSTDEHNVRVTTCLQSR